MASPVLSRKLQCFSLTCAPPRTRPRQPAASISSQAFWPGGLRNVLPPVRARTGWVASRLARISAMRAAMRRLVAGPGAEAGAHDDGAGRQRRVAVGEGERRRRQPHRLAGAGHDLRPVEARRPRRRHRRRRSSPPRRRSSRGCRTGTRARSSPAAAACSATVASSARGAGDDAVGLHHDRRRSRARAGSPRRRRRRRARSGWWRRRAPCTGTSCGRAARNAARSVGLLGPHQRLGRAADAEPGQRAERRIRLHAAAQRRQRVEPDGSGCGSAIIRPAAWLRRLQRGQLAPAARPPIA